MKKILSTFFISIILSSLISTPVKAEFDAKFYSMNDIIYYDGSGGECNTSSSGGSVGDEFLDNVDWSKVNLPESVTRHKDKITAEAKKQGLNEKYVPLLLVLVNQESGGNGNDIFQSSESKGLPVNTLGLDESIAAGVEHFKVVSEKAKSYNLSIWAAFQAYNFGTAFIDHLYNNKKDWSIETAKEYSRTVVAPSLGNTSGATYSYVNDVSNLFPDKFLYTNGGNFYYVPVAWRQLGMSDEDIVKNANGTSSSSSSSSDSSSSSSSSSSSGKYTFIGDSLTVGVKDKLTSTFSGSSVDAYVSRGIKTPGQAGGSVMDYLNSNPPLKDSVVINIGANDGGSGDFANNTKEMLEKLKDKTTYLVNNYSGQSSVYENVNKTFESLKSDKVKVLDWKSYVDSNGGREKLYTTADGMDHVHMSEEGKEAYIKFLQEKLSGSDSSSSSSCGSESGGKFSNSTEESYRTEDGFSIISQYDPRWYNKPGNGGTRGDTSCGPFSLIMAISALTGKTPDIDDFINKSTKYNYSGGPGTILDVTEMVEEYGLRREAIEQSEAAINKVLDSGGLIYTTGKGAKPYLPTYGHAILIRKKTSNGKWKVADPGGTDASYQAVSNKDWDPSEILPYMDSAFALYKK